MNRSGTVKKVVNKIPEIIKYGQANIGFESSVKPQVKLTTTSAIKILKQVAFQHKLVSLSANQIGLDQRVFVALKGDIMQPGKWQQYQKQFQINNIKNAQAGYQAIIAPIEITSSFEDYYCFQECPSFPGLKFKVKIPIFINIKYLTESSLLQLAQKQLLNSHFSNIPESMFTTQKISGFKGRVWDHEIRHLEGLLPIQQKICNGQFYLQDQYKSSIENIEYYKHIKRIQSNFMEANLKKLGKQQQQKIKDRVNRKMKQKQHYSSFQDITETLESLSGKSSFKDRNMQKPNKKNKASKKLPAKNN